MTKQCTSPAFPPDALAKARDITLLALDVDGVLTDGALYFGARGEQLKRFHIHDGLGLKLLRDNGINVALITGRRSAMVEKRAQELGITHVIQGREDKLTALRSLVDQLGQSLDTTCYIVDDLPDLAAIQAAAFGVTVANGHHSVCASADWQTQRDGGAGAVRELCDLILVANDYYDSTLNKFGG